MRGLMTQDSYDIRVFVTGLSSTGIWALSQERSRITNTSLACCRHLQGVQPHSDSRLEANIYRPMIQEDVQRHRRHLMPENR